MKIQWILPILILLTACGTTKMIPEIYFQSPPEILLTPPKELKPIKPPIPLPKNTNNKDS